MSRKKHNVAYIKPDEPKFLRELKIQSGYQEGPSVNTKFEKLQEALSEDYEDREEEKPVVVVLEKGDLSAEEAAAFEKQKVKEEENTPADLSKPVIFRKTKYSSVDSENTECARKRLKKPKQAVRQNVLSFNDEDEEEE